MTEPNGKSEPLFARRRMLRILGAAAAGMLAGRPAAQTARPACVLTPRQTEGPYFVDERLNRSDVRVDPSDGSTRAGVPLSLALRVSALGGALCSPLEGAMVDIWHCDASGLYSDTRDPGGDTTGRKFLRGYQLTSATGDARFQTIIPGWYEGRAVHIHFKVRTADRAGKRHEFTSQLYFDDVLIDAVHAQNPYAERGRRTMKNDADGLFRRGGRQLTLAPVRQGQGYAATFEVGVQLG